MHERHLVNTLGALALAVADLMTGRAGSAAGTSTSGAAALAVLLQAGGPGGGEPGAGPGELGVSALGRHVGLSQPAAARMVDTLQARGLVRRRRESGNRTTVHLTPDGARAARRVLTERADRLADLLEPLTPDERQVLGRLLDRLLPGVHDRIGDGDRVCRLCDRHGCTEAGTRCPVGWAARGRPAEPGRSAEPDSAGPDSAQPDSAEPNSEACSGA